MLYKLLVLLIPSLVWGGNIITFPAQNSHLFFAEFLENSLLKTGFHNYNSHFKLSCDKPNQQLTLKFQNNTYCQKILLLNTSLKKLKNNCDDQLSLKVSPIKNCRTAFNSLIFPVNTSPFSSRAANVIEANSDLFPGYLGAPKLFFDKKKQTSADFNRINSDEWINTPSEEALFYLHLSTSSKNIKPIFLSDFKKLIDYLSINHYYLKSTAKQSNRYLKAACQSFDNKVNFSLFSNKYPNQILTLKAFNVDCSITPFGESFEQNELYYSQGLTFPYKSSKNKLIFSKLNELFRPLSFLKLLQK